MKCREKRIKVKVVSGDEGSEFMVFNYLGIQYVVEFHC